MYKWDSVGMTKEPSGLRIMQADEFYDAYLNLYYQRHPHLRLADSMTQMKCLFRDGFNAVHAIVPYLKNLGCKTDYFILNCLPLQKTWAEENNILFPGNPFWAEELLRRRIEWFKPDVLYLCNPIHFDARFLRTLTFQPRCVIAWQAADVPITADWTGYDIMLSGLPGVLTLAPCLGARQGVLFYPGMPSWIARSVESIEQDTDVVFVGGISPTQHAKRHQLLEALARAATKYGFSLNLHLSCAPELITPAMRPYLRPPVFGLAMHKALRRGKIVFDAPGTVGLRRPDGSYACDLAKGHIATMRLHEATAGGSLVLLHAESAHTQLFDSGREIVTFSNEREMIANILYYLSHEQERMAIADAGKQRSLGEWNMKNRAAAFMDIISKYFN